MRDFFSFLSSALAHGLTIEVEPDRKGCGHPDWNGYDEYPCPFERVGEHADPCCVCDFGRGM
jgi:hypothetical protein